MFFMDFAHANKKYVEAMSTLSLFIGIYQLPSA